MEITLILFILLDLTSCEGYVLHQSVSPSVRQSYLFVSSTPLKPLQGIVYNFVVFGTSREDVPTPVNSDSLNVRTFELEILAIY